MKSRMNGIILTSLILLIWFLLEYIGIFLEKVTEPSFPLEAVLLAPLIFLLAAGVLVCLIISIIMLLRRRDAVYLLPLLIGITLVATIFDDNRYFHAISLHRNIENYIRFTCSYGIMIVILYCMFVVVRLNDIKRVWVKIVFTLIAIFCLLLSELVLILCMEILIVDLKFHHILLIAVIAFFFSYYILRKLWWNTALVQKIIPCGRSGKKLTDGEMTDEKE